MVNIFFLNEKCMGKILNRGKLYYIVCLWSEKRLLLFYLVYGFE